jgi:DNA-binding NarL/FixJ family response regulator
MSKAKKKPVTKTVAPSVRVMIVDDHPVVREGFARYINGEPGMSVCCQEAGAAEALSVFCKTHPDVVLVDLTLEEGSGLELIKDIKSQDASAKILVISGHDEDLYAERCLRAGAMGYISKHEAADKVVEAIHHVLEGNLYLSERVSRKLLRLVTGNTNDNDRTGIDSLSDRELEVFELIGQGKSINEIAEHLCLSPKTVETYRAHLKEKLNLESSHQLAREAFIWSVEGN